MDFAYDPKGIKPTDIGDLTMRNSMNYSEITDVHGAQRMNPSDLD